MLRLNKSNFLQESAEDFTDAARMAWANKRDIAEIFVPVRRPWHYSADAWLAWVMVWGMTALAAGAVVDSQRVLYIVGGILVATFAALMLRDGTLIRDIRQMFHDWRTYDERHPQGDE